jgi:hypothetical protein
MKFVGLAKDTPFTITPIGPVVAPAGTTAVSVVVDALVTVAIIPLNVTTLFTGDMLKFVPVRVTIVPVVPFAGENSVNVGSSSTIKLDELVRVIPLDATVIGPDVAPGGTVVVILEALEDEMVAVAPLNLTVGLLKLVPEMITVDPKTPPEGLKPVNVGVGNTSKFVALLIVVPFTVSEITPSTAAAGTTTVRDVVVAAVTVASLLLVNRTVFSEGVALKFVPVITMVAPTAPLAGLKPVMDGYALTTIFLFAPSEPAAPGAANVRFAAFNAPS